MEATQPKASVAKTSDSISDPRINSELSRCLRLLALALAGVVALVSAVAFSGWMVLKDAFLFNSGASVEFLLWSLSFFLLLKAKSPLNKLGYVPIALVAATAALNTANSLFDLDVGLTQPLMSLGDSPLNFPGPLMPDLAISFFTLSAATVFLSLKLTRANKYPDLHKIIALVLIVPNLVITGTSMAGLQSICTMFGCVKPSLFASASFILAGLAIVFAFPDEGITAPFTYNTAGGRLTRSIFLALTPCIPIFGLLTLGQTHGWYDQSIALGLMVLTIIGLFIAGIAWGIKKVDVIEEEKTVALQLLRDSLTSFVPESDKTFKLVCLECGKDFDDTTLIFCPTDGSTLGKLADKLKVGSVFCDRYEISNFIGAGGCSIIYEARHMLLNKQVALKLLRTNFTSETKYVQRFQRESKATSQLEHPNIVGVHDFGISFSGQPYIVMDYLRGLSLGDRVDNSGPLPWRQALPIFIDICEGLTYAHQKGVLHRDLKPANIMLCDEEPGKPAVVKIVDFGLAKMAESSDAQITQTGELIGSPTYMSPEQCRGEGVDVRTDVYSMGALIYHVLSGQPAVETGNVFEALQLQISEPPKPLSAHLQLPHWLSSLVYKALEKDPERRQQSIEEMLNDLRAGMISAQEPVYNRVSE